MKSLPIRAVIFISSLATAGLFLLFLMLATDGTVWEVDWPALMLVELCIGLIIALIIAIFEREQSVDQTPTVLATLYDRVSDAEDRIFDLEDDVDMVKSRYTQTRLVLATTLGVSLVAYLIYRRKMR